MKFFIADAFFFAGPLTQVSLSYGATTWMSPVTDAEYASAARK